MDLINEVAHLEQQLKIKKTELQQRQNSCQHQWGDVKYDPIVHKSYYSEGDPPGTMGIDRQLPMWVPESVKKQWKRECKLCHKVEITTFVRDAKKAGSIPGTTCTEEVPIFQEHPMAKELKDAMRRMR